MSDHHSSGQFTDPWYPPQTIPSGQIAEWRSESAGIMTGAIGSARYSINVSDGSGPGPHLEYIDIDWDNPYAGFNSANASATNDFSGTASTDLIPASYIQSGSLPNGAKVAGFEFEAWLDTLLFPPYIIANAVSYDDTNAFYGVGYQAPPSPDFTGGIVPNDLRTLPRKLNNNASPAQWQGQWEGDGVFVTLVDMGDGKMSVSVTERTAKPMIQFTEQFILGEVSWVGQDLIQAAISKDLGTSSAVSKVFRHASAAALANLESPQKIFRSVATKLAQKASIRLAPERVTNAGAAIAAFAGVPRSTAFLLHGVSLTLYDVFFGATKQGQLLNYRRSNSERKTVADMLLDFIPILH